jgi:integrase
MRSFKWAAWKSAWYLFSELTAGNKNDDRGALISKRFSRLKDKLGFGRSYGFHSFRSTLSNLFETAGVNETFAARIIGHKIDTMTYGLYSAGISDAQKREILDGIKLPDLSKEWEGNA